MSPSESKKQLQLGHGARMWGLCAVQGAFGHVVDEQRDQVRQRRYVSI